MTATPSALNALLLYCRPGFEKECAAEIQEHARQHAVEGFSKAKPDSGYVLFTPYETTALSGLMQALRFDRLCFARQMVFVAPLISSLPVTDRVTPLLDAARRLARSYSTLFLETADTNEAKELSTFVRQFNAPLTRAVLAARLIDASNAKAPRLHLFFITSTTVYVGISWPNNSAPWPMGIPRLKFPRSAPSRSTLKLEEAFLTLLDRPEQQLQPGMRAVDLGAAPGGWTWQLVKRSIRVIAVDNGPMDAALMESGIVEHLRVDGFRYQPPIPVDWLVCDMVEQPSRIANLVAGWFTRGHCRQAIFNLKLPMKKRFEEMKLCRELITSQLNQADIHFCLRFKQLYHDREEVTAYLARLA